MILDAVIYRILDFFDYITAPLHKPRNSHRVRLADALCLRYVGARDIYVLSGSGWERVLNWQRRGHSAVLCSFTVTTVRDLESRVLIAPAEGKS